jgi:hypothetical protein
MLPEPLVVIRSAAHVDAGMELLTLIWSGLGTGGQVFLNTQLGLSQTLRMVRRNYDLTGMLYVFMILIPRRSVDPGQADRGMGRLLAHADRGGIGVRRLARAGLPRQHGRHLGNVRRLFDDGIRLPVTTSSFAPWRGGP